ncbi:recombinase family protein [Paenibacillus sp. y28]|uniref:recombinase family protein n=1 Tax=Paenibacillus sp. y28 TaxID=3129110 RepID=UPI0030180033
MVKELRLYPVGEYCGYLRKSRADIENEDRGDEDTYAKHERMLLELARRCGINLTKIYREKPITGERISARPEMIQLLDDVEAGRWKGVLVVEVERLARGDTMDQGIVAQAFKYSNTLIITPMRTYNPNDPNDEEYFEFGLFMSRREFKTITRRLQSGRERSVRDGKYPGNKPPYGYNRVKLPQGGFTLEPHPEQAPIVQLIFSLYTHSDPEKRLGTGRLANYLNEELKVPSATNKKWTVETLNTLIRNSVYAGWVKWGERRLVKKRDGGSRPRRSKGDFLEVPGLHPPLISNETRKLALEILNENWHPPAQKGLIVNPLAGLIKCACCGSNIVMKGYKGKIPDSLICVTRGCKNVSSYFHLVEERLINALKMWLSSYEIKIENENTNEHESNNLKLNAQRELINALNRKKSELQLQMDNLHDLLEQKVYSTEIFLQRSSKLSERMNEINEAITTADEQLQQELRQYETKVNIIPRIKHVLETYYLEDVPARKNELLKTILHYATYRKDKGGRWSNAIDKFELVLYPIIPK